MNTSRLFETLPVAWYSDPAILDAERRHVFAVSPAYLGCVPLVPQRGNYHTLPQRDHAEMLLNDGQRIRLLSNVCLHRSMLMLTGRGTAKGLVCPMHRWAYALDGRLLGAPHYESTPCMHLPEQPVQAWHGVLFGGSRDVLADLSPLGRRPDLDVSGYQLGQVQLEEQPVNWKVPVEVLLENYHVPVIHPGLSRYVDPASWFGNDGGFDSERFMFQEMKPHPDFAHNPNSPVFERWQQCILRINGGRAPRTATIIALLFPNIFLEWYPFMFVATIYVPRSPGRSLMMREFYYDPAALQVAPEYPELAKAAWDENQAQDDTVHEALQRGRELRWAREPDGPSGYAVYQSPTEDSVKVFHQELMKLLS